MKKLALILPVLFLFACGGSHEDKNAEPVADSTKVETAMPDTATAAAAADSTSYVCACDHKCKTSAECEKNCGTECGGLH